MKNILLIAVFSVFLSGSVIQATIVNARFQTNISNGKFHVTLQLNTDTGTDDLGCSTIKLKYNETALQYPLAPTEDTDFLFHNFTSGLYLQGMVDKVLEDELIVSIILLENNMGTVVADSGSWTDIVTINFTIIDPEDISGLYWKTEEVEIFDADNSTPWVLGVFDDALSQPLPVELISFNAEVQNERIVLRWATATESENDRFEIQRNTPEISDRWETIGSVDGAGSSTLPVDYSFVDNDLFGRTKFNYRIKQVDNDGTFEYSEEIEVLYVPVEYELSQNFPNPFNPTTKIRFSIIETSEVSVNIYNELGQHVTEILHQEFNAGRHEVDFDASDLASGVYFYRIVAGKFTDVKKMLLLK